MAKDRRNLTPQELQEYLEMLRLCNSEKWKSLQISGNTALIHNGIEFAKTQESVANLLENTKNNWLSQMLSECGVPQGVSVNINSQTGEIKEALPDLAKKVTKIAKKSKK